MSNIHKCRECKKKKPLSEFSLDRGKPRRLCKKCASIEQSARYKNQGARGREKVLANWYAYFERDPTKARFTLSKGAAKQKGVAWELTLEDYRFINSQICYYCGGALPPKGIGLDRIDNAQGYTMNNVLPCCSICNIIKGDNLSTEEMVLVARTVQEYRAGSNPKDAIGLTKVSVTKVPFVALLHAAHAMMNGADKYGSYNFRETKVQASIYIDACLRHVAAWFNREERAEDSGVHHLGHAMACLAILLDSQAEGNLIDDRPSGGIGTIKALTEINAAIAEKK